MDTDKKYVQWNIRIKYWHKQLYDMSLKEIRKWNIIWCEKCL